MSVEMQHLCFAMTLDLKKFRKALQVTELSMISFGYISKHV